MVSLKNSKKCFLFKKWFVFIEAAIAAVVLVLAALLFLGKSGGKTCKISVVVQDSNSSRWSAFKYGLKKAAEDQAVEMIAASTGESMTAEEQLHTINSEIENGADALVIQPVPGLGKELLKKIPKKIPVMLVGSMEAEHAGNPCVQPDHYAMGESLAKELLKDYNSNVKKKTFGIVTQSHDSQAVIDRDKGFQDALAGMGAKFSWSASLAWGMSLKDQAKVDFIIALDDRSLVAAGEASAANNLHGALVYGIGNSTEAVYHLDMGTVECLVVPDEFNMGYQSLTQAAKRLSHPFYKMQGMAVNYTVLRREEIFSEKNQELLFTMSQQY